MKFSSLVALEVVILITSSAASDENFFKMIMCRISNQQVVSTPIQFFKQRLNDCILQTMRKSYISERNKSRSIQILRKQFDIRSNQTTYLTHLSLTEERAERLILFTNLW